MELHAPDTSLPELQYLPAATYAVAVEQAPAPLQFPLSPLFTQMLEQPVHEAAQALYGSVPAATFAQA